MLCISEQSQDQKQRASYSHAAPRCCCSSLNETSCLDSGARHPWLRLPQHQHGADGVDVLLVSLERDAEKSSWVCKISCWLLAVGSCSYDPRCKSANNTDDQGVLRGSCGKRAMDGEAPELNPGWVHRRMNSYPEVRHAQSIFTSPLKNRAYCALLNGINY